MKTKIGVDLGAKEGDKSVMMVSHGKQTHRADRPCKSCRELKINLIKKAVIDILWMARRYANGRSTYAPDMFNEAYDILRIELGDDIDFPKARDLVGTKYFDITIEHSKDHPYAMHGNENAQMNQSLSNRIFYKKP